MPRIFIYFASGLFSNYLFVNLQVNVAFKNIINLKHF